MIKANPYMDEDVKMAHPYTVELQWLEQMWNHEKMVETEVVRVNDPICM